MKKLLLALLISIPFTVFGQDIGGTGWMCYEDDGSKKIILFEYDGTFTYLNVVNESGNEGIVFSQDSETWTIDGNTVVLSWSNGGKIASLTINNNSDGMAGTAINFRGLVTKMTSKLIK